MADVEMNYYWRRVPMLFGEDLQLWKIDEVSATRFGYMNPELGSGLYFRAQSGETIWDVMRRDGPQFEEGKEPAFHATELHPGQYYPRMARPVETLWETPPVSQPGADIDANVIAVAAGQLTALTRHLERIFQTVHPIDTNFGVYGHDIRNLLILACTEVEAHWKGIMTANGKASTNLRTSDYFALKAAMRLDEYSVRYPNYPWLADSNPFSTWEKDAASKSLPWYDAYNAVKHNRELEFERATLRHALDAVTACAVLIVAQFGETAASWTRSEAHSFYQFERFPCWPQSQVYFYSNETSGAWLPVNFDFSKLK